MGDALRKVQTGQGLKIPAAAYNAFVDAALDLKRRQANIARNATHIPDQNGVILIKNICGEDRERFEMLGLDSPVNGPADNEVAFQERLAMNGVTPTPEKHFCRFALLLEPIAADAMGLAVVQGLTIARMLVLDERHAFAGVDPVWPLLVSAPLGGARILWKEAGTSTSETDLKWGVVLLGNQVEPCVGVLQESDIYNNGHAAVLAFSDPVVLTLIAPGIVQVEMYA